MRMSPATLTSLTACLLMAACGPDQSPEDGRNPRLIVSTEHSSAALFIDLTFPEAKVRVAAHLCVGLEDVGLDAQDSVTLERLELRAGDLTVPIAGRFDDPAIDSRSGCFRKHIYDSAIATGAVGAACGHGSATLTYEVDSAAHGRASGEIPITLTCQPDRRAGELATRPLGTNPPDRPCALTQGELLVDLGWTTDGELEITEQTYMGQPEVKRVVGVKDDAGRPITYFSMLDGVLESQTDFTYEGARVVSMRRVDFGGEPRITEMTWTSDRALETLTGDAWRRYTLSENGLTVTEREAGGETTLRFGRPITLTAHLTRTGMENAADHEARSVTRTPTIGGGAVELTYRYAEGRIVEETYSASAGSFAQEARTWVYDCAR